MDSYVASFIKAVIAITFWTLLLGIFIVIWQLSQLQNFQQYASGVIARQGGLTSTAIEQIDKESRTHYRGVFRLVDNDDAFMTDSATGKLTATAKNSDLTIKPYGTGLVYRLQSTPTIFDDIPVIGSTTKRIKLITAHSTTSLNRNAGAVAVDDTTTIGDTDNTDSKLDMLPQNETIIVKKSDLGDVSQLNLNKLLKTTATINNVNVVLDGREEVVAKIDKIGNSYVIKPLANGSTSLTLQIELTHDSIQTQVTRTYVVVVV